MPLLNASLKLTGESLVVNLGYLERRIVVCQVAWRFGRVPKD